MLRKNLQNYTSTTVGRVYRLFDYEDDFKWKNCELQSCRSRRKLQFSYKVYLHPGSNKKLQIFENRLELYYRGPRR
jgi:hypothetical protein